MTDSKTAKVKPGTYDFTPKFMMALRKNLRRYQHRRSPKMPEYDTRQIGGKPIRHIAAFGTHCLPATLLQNAGLRRYALPFDWLHSTPGMIRHCLETDFVDFLPPSGEKLHKAFRDRFGLNDIFLHHDPASPKDRAYFERSIERFRKLLDSRDAKLFVMISRPSNPIGWHFPDLVDLIHSKTRNADLIAIQLQPQRDRGEKVGLELAQERNGSRLYDFRPHSDESALGYFPDVVDELMLLRLIYHYQLDLADAL